MKVKSLLFIEFCINSGSVNGLLTEIDYLKNRYKKDFKITVITHPNSILYRKLKNTEVDLYIFPALDMIEVVSKPLIGFIKYSKALFFISRIVVKNKIDIIHCNHYIWGIYANPIGFIFNKQVIIHLKDVVFLKPKLARILTKFNPKTKYIAVSRYVNKLFVEKYKFSQKNMHMLYDGIDEKVFTRIKNKNLYLKFTEQKKILIMMSRVVPERNIEIFIEIAAMLQQEYPNLNFYHFGSDSYTTDNEYLIYLKHYVKELNLAKKFAFFDYEVDPQKVAKRLKEAFLTIVPATQFALPNIAIESMMCGTPVIALETGGNTEIINNNHTGTLIKINSPTLYVESIKIYLENNVFYEKLSKNAAAFTHKTFSSHTQFKKLVDNFYLNQ